MEHSYHAVVSGRLTRENNPGKETWMKYCSALLSKCILRRIIRTQSGKYSVSWSLYQLFVFICLCTILNINVQIIFRIVDCDVVMLLFAVSLKAGSITGVPMSPGYGGYQSTTSPPYYTTTTFARTGYHNEA
jgi:hypothetical protein